jgi:hypothetical protein
VDQRAERKKIERAGGFEIQAVFHVVKVFSDLRTVRLKNPHHSVKK